MSLLDYLAADYPVIKATDTGTYILDLMNSEARTALPLVIDGNYVALIKEDDVLNWADANSPITQADFLNFKPMALDAIHPYDAAVLINDWKIPMLPIVDEAFKYLGVVTPYDLFRFFTENTGLSQSGGVLILSVKANDYSLSEIARICESNDVIILNVQILDYDKELMDVVIKTNTKDLQALKSSFLRYEYDIKGVYGAFKTHYDHEDRYKLLMNYINM